MVQTWYVQFDGRMSGPYRTRDLRHFVAEGRVTSETPVSLDRVKWFKASKVVGLFGPLSTIAGDGSAVRRLSTEEELAIPPGASMISDGGPATAAPRSSQAPPSHKSSNGPVNLSTVAGGPPMVAEGPPLGPGDLPEQFGRYKILRRLGKGGMGTVYLAHDSQIDRTVALKVPLIRDNDPELLQRFLREARAAAASKNENVCRIYDVGESGGIPYVTMEYIEGELLADHVAPGRRPSQRKLAKLLRTIALVLQEAHDRGIVHRDLKPANIMINRRGRPIIMDFGLALVTRPDDPRLTRDGAVMGTLAYMAPEQVRGDLDKIGPPCDIYALGVIIYELLTGRLPFEGSGGAIMQQVLTEPPAPPSKHRGDTDPALESICLRAMAKRIEDRYGSMRELADALGDYLEGRPVPPPPQVDPRRDSQFNTGPRTSKKAPRPKPSFWKRLRRRVTAMMCLGLVGYLFYQFPETSWMVIERARDVILALINADEKTYRIDVSGPNVVVTLDGDVIRIESLDRPMTLTDPREYHLVVVRDGRLEEDRKITVAEGGRPATIRLVAEDGARELEVVEPIPPPARAPRPAPEVKQPDSGNTPSTGLDPVVQALIVQLSDKDAEVRCTAAENLQELGAKAAVPALIQRVTDDVWVENYASIYEDSSKTAALNALRALAPVKVEATLLAAMNTNDRDGRAWASRQLTKHRQSTVLAAAPASGLAPSAKLSPSGRAMVLRLDDPEWDVREQAVKALGDLRESAAIPHLIPILKDKDFRVRVAVAEALRALDDASAVPALADRVADDVHDLKYDNRIWSYISNNQTDFSKEAALQALRALDREAVEDALIRASNAKNPRVRAWAAGIISREASKSKTQDKPP
ncbi:hypothetical protein BH23PLA1_BH23PLA1_11320 [soil metagenome]